MAKQWPTGPLLCHDEPNGPSLSVLAALEESGLDIECFPIYLLHGERHLVLHDSGTLADPVPENQYGITKPLAADFAVEGEGPVLVVDGEAMSESVFLAQFLDETAGGCGLQPHDPYTHWQMLMWCRQVTERLSPAVGYLGNLAYSRDQLTNWEPWDFAMMTAGILSEDLRQRWQELFEGKVDEQKRADSEAKIDQFAERVENQLTDGREWLIGPFSIADLETFAWMRSAPLIRPEAFEGKPALNAWMARVEARPSVQRALARAETDDPRTSFAPGPEINRWG